MFTGVFVGDSLGSPYEFRCNANVEYSYRIVRGAHRNSQYQGVLTTEAGEITDDSMMTLSLLICLLRDGEYSEDEVILSYLRWANDRELPSRWMMGTNTRNLMRGVVRISGFRLRYKKIFGDPQVAERAQSNGSLMRCSPLSLLFDNGPVMRDTYLTNPNYVNADASLVWVSGLRLALQGRPPSEIYRKMKEISQTLEVVAVFKDVERGTIRDVNGPKGWVLSALYLGLWVLFRMTEGEFTTFRSVMDWIVRDHRGSDTDTNASIVGGLCGAIFGYRSMYSEDEDGAANVDLVYSRLKDPRYGPLSIPDREVFFDRTLSIYSEGE